MTADVRDGLAQVLTPIMKSWGVRSGHGEWSDEETQRNAATNAADAALAYLAARESALPCHQGVRGCTEVSEHYHPDEKYAKDAARPAVDVEAVTTVAELDALPVGSVVECTWFTWEDTARPFGPMTKTVSRLFMVTEHMLIAERYEVSKHHEAYGALARFPGGIRVVTRTAAEQIAALGVTR